MTETKLRSYDGNVATLPEAQTENARNLSGDKEETERYRVVVFEAADKAEDSTFHIPVDARFWMARRSDASVVYCSVWLHTKDGRWFSGYGSAGGYGYHKESAALEEALTSAGIKLEASIHGCGEGPMRHALLAVTDAAGWAGLPREVI